MHYILVLFRKNHNHSFFEKSAIKGAKKREMYPKISLDKKSNPHRNEYINMQSAVYYDEGYRRLGLAKIVVCSGFFLCLTFNNLLNIIVMLILAGVTIAILVNAGLFERAGEAVERNKAAQLEEQIELWKANNLIAEYTGDKESTEDFLERLVKEGLLEQSEADELLTSGAITIGGTTVVLEDDMNIPIPTGFTASTVEGETKISTGKVVIAPDGSEFVWVPVDFPVLDVTDTADDDTAIKIGFPFMKNLANMLKG